jgi:hypothetical protein
VTAFNFSPILHEKNYSKRHTRSITEVPPSPCLSPKKNPKKDLDWQQVALSQASLVIEKDLPTGNMKATLSPKKI